MYPASPHKNLIRNRTACKAQLTRKRYIAFENPENVSILDQCQQKLEEIYGNLERMQSDIESLKGNSETEAERAVFESANFKSNFDIKQRKC